MRIELRISRSVDPRVDILMSHFRFEIRTKGARAQPRSSHVASPQRKRMLCRLSMIGP